jgi:hypothetical protein
LGKVVCSPLHLVAVFLFDAYTSQTTYFSGLYLTVFLEH